MSEKRKRGLDFFGHGLGKDKIPGLQEHIDSDAFGRECAAWAADFAFGTVWTREGLEPGKRSCAVLGMLIALRQTEEVKYHVRIGLQNGLTLGELEEVLYLSVPYAGFPAANSARQAMIEVLREIESEKP